MKYLLTGSPDRSLSHWPFSGWLSEWLVRCRWLFVHAEIWFPPRVEGREREERWMLRSQNFNQEWDKDDWLAEYWVKNGQDKLP